MIIPAASSETEKENYMLRAAFEHEVARTYWYWAERGIAHTFVDQQLPFYMAAMRAGEEARQ